MSFLDSIIHKRLDEAKELLFSRLDEIVAKRLEEAKRYVAEDTFEFVELEEAGNIVKMGRVQKIRRRIRRNAKGRIVVQKNVRRSSIKGYRISGNTVKRIPATVRLHKARMLKRSWKTTRKSKLRRTLLKRKMSLRRRSSMGIR
jgi:PHD/YefM family antitoxin component YafN of YafNO toxin-antitoxin module